MFEEPRPTQEEMARERTALAKDRTIMANERTLAAWIRTGLGVTAAGLALIKLSADASPSWLATLAGAAATIAGMALVLIGQAQHWAASKTMKSTNLPQVSRWLIGAVSMVVVAASLIAMILFVV